MMRPSSVLHLHRSPLLPLSSCYPNFLKSFRYQTLNFKSTQSRSYFSTSSPSPSSHQVSSPSPPSPSPQGLLMTTRRIEVHTPAGLVELEIPVLEISLRDLSRCYWIFLKETAGQGTLGALIGVGAFLIAPKVSVFLYAIPVLTGTLGLFLGLWRGFWKSVQYIAVEKEVAASIVGSLTINTVKLIKRSTGIDANDVVIPFDKYNSALNSVFDQLTQASLRTGGAPAHFIVNLLVSKLRTVVQMTPQEKITANEIIEKGTKRAVNATFNAYISKQLAISHYGIALIAVVSFGAASPSRFFSASK